MIISSLLIVNGECLGGAFILSKNIHLMWEFMFLPLDLCMYCTLHEPSFASYCRYFLNFPANLKSAYLHPCGECHLTGLKVRNAVNSVVELQVTAWQALKNWLLAAFDKPKKNMEGESRISTGLPQSKLANRKPNTQKESSQGLVWSGLPPNSHLPPIIQRSPHPVRYYKQHVWRKSFLGLAKAAGVSSFDEGGKVE